MKIYFLPLSLVLLIASCASHKDVRPGEDGINHVLVRGSERESAERKAIKEANHFCAEQKKHPVFVTEKTDYTGSMNESDRELLKQASTAAMFVGGNSSPVGSLGTAGYIMTNGSDYVSDMKFKCQ